MTIFGFASRFSSMTTRVFSSDSSRTAVISLRILSFTKSAMRSTSVARFTLNGISVITICSLPPLISSMPALPRTFMLPRPVSRYCFTPLRPQIAQPAGKSGPAVHEQVRKCGWENRRLGARLVVVRHEIDRVLLHIGHERGAEMRHARFGVAHGRRRIAFDRAEIALTID